MQTVDLTEFTNSSGWHVIHDPNTMQYLIKSSNGKARPGSWTRKRFADKALLDYLIFVQETTPQAKAAKKKAKAKKTNKETVLGAPRQTPVKATAEELAKYVNT